MKKLVRGNFKIRSGTQQRRQNAVFQNKFLGESKLKIKYFGRLKVKSFSQSLIEPTMVKVNQLTIFKSTGNEATENCANFGLGGLHMRW